MENLSVILPHLATVVPTILAAIGLLYTHWQWRDAERKKKEEELRKTEVMNWSLDTIETLQKISIITKNQDIELNSENKLKELSISTSVLIEKGRLFFKNTDDKYGESKEEAYQGFRPEILDQILIAHIAAMNWVNLSTQEKEIMAAKVQKCVRRFVTLAQKEVGRERTANASTARGGDSISLEGILRSSGNL